MTHCILFRIFIIPWPHLSFELRAQTLVADRSCLWAIRRGRSKSLKMGIVFSWFQLLVVCYFSFGTIESETKELSIANKENQPTTSVGNVIPEYILNCCCGYVSFSFFRSYYLY